MKKIVSLLTLVTFILCIGKIKSYTKYNVGDIVPYNGMNFYVIKNSSSNDDTVTLLKAEPLTVDEVNLYGGVGTENNHVNMYATTDISSPYYKKAYNNNGYGGMAYYSSTTCGYSGSSDCRSDYASSEIKYVIDAWKTAKVPLATEARLLTYDELLNNLGYENNISCTGGCYYSGSLANVSSWVYNSNYWYWTMSPNNDSASYVWFVDRDGGLTSHHVSDNYEVVRPVIVLNKTTLGDPDESIVDNNIDQSSKNDVNNDSKETKTSVKVANTYMSSSIIIIILGFIIASVSVLIIYKFSNKKR